LAQVSTTPSKITPAITNLCRELVEAEEPRFLPVAPIPDADPNDCFPVVERYVAQQGGSVCYGWQIWEWPGVMIEAEFHAVWRSPIGELHDVTPKRGGVPNILFLPDSRRRYEGRQVCNVRHALSSDPRVAEFIKACEEEFEFMNRGERAMLHGALDISGRDAEEILARFSGAKPICTANSLRDHLGQDVTSSATAAAISSTRSAAVVEKHEPSNNALHPPGARVARSSG
jgi:hypothetical protein